MKALITNTLEKYAQVISAEMMSALKEAAKARGVSLDLEIALRLMTSMAEPELSQDNTLYGHIMHTQFLAGDAVAECKRNREKTQYLYEIEKLRLYLRFEERLPRGTKEHFSVIDVKTVTKLIKAELAAEEQTKEGG